MKPVLNLPCLYLHLCKHIKICHIIHTMIQLIFRGSNRPKPLNSDDLNATHKIYHLTAIGTMSNCFWVSPLIKKNAHVF